MPNMKRHGMLTKSQLMTMEQSQICVSQHYRWHMMIEGE